MNSVLQSVQAVEGVRKVCREEGEQFDIAGVHLTWKVKAHDSAYSFSVMEATLAPGEGVPVHSHPSVESFYVLSGDADFFRVTGGEEDWIRCEAGELMILPPNSLHGLYNHGPSDCRLLGISTAVHQTFFDAVADADRTSSFASMPPADAMSKIAQIASDNHMYFAPMDVSQTKPQKDEWQPV
jgi:quercetin dioxygenase-like cupin family protein